MSTEKWQLQLSRSRLPSGGERPGLSARARAFLEMHHCDFHRVRHAFRLLTSQNLMNVISRPWAR